MSKEAHSHADRRRGMMSAVRFMHASEQRCTECGGALFDKQGMPVHPPIQWNSLSATGRHADCKAPA